MSRDQYFGDYVKFFTATKTEGAAIANADNLIGDVYQIVFKREGAHIIAWLRSRFDKDVCFFDEKTSRTLNVIRAKGWSMRAILSFVAFSEAEDPCAYWGEAAIICNDPKIEDATDVFTQEVAKKMAEGSRLDINLGNDGVRQMVEADGKWLPQTTVDIPDVGEGSVVLKSHRSLLDKTIESGRRKSVGCIIGTVATFVFVALVIVLVLRFFGVF